MSTSIRPSWRCACAVSASHTRVFVTLSAGLLTDTHQRPSSRRRCRIGATRTTVPTGSAGRELGSGWRKDRPWQAMRQSRTFGSAPNP